MIECTPMVWAKIWKEQPVRHAGLWATFWWKQRKKQNVCWTWKTIINIIQLETKDVTREQKDCQSSIYAACFLIKQQLGHVIWFTNKQNMDTGISLLYNQHAFKKTAIDTFEKTEATAVINALTLPLGMKFFLLVTDSSVIGILATYKMHHSITWCVCQMWKKVSHLKT